MSINCEANPCPVLVNASCVFYEGPNLICLGVNTNETLESALEKINSVVCQVLSQQGSSGTSGTSGSSGTSGTRGSSGTSGRNGSSGTSGSTGSNGSSGTSGEKGDIYRTFSETCFTLGDGGTIFVEPGLAYTPAQSIVIANSALIYQICTVISYNNITGELVFSIPTTVVGTIDEYCTWDVNLNGAAGGDGSDGTSGSNGSNGSNGSSGTDGTSGTSGLSCNSLEVTNITLDPQTYGYKDCTGTSFSVEIPAEEFISICAIVWDENENFNIVNNGVCTGTSGTSGTSGAGTGGGSSCPDHFKLAAVSGKFNSGNNPNSPDIKYMFGGNDELGWSYGLYSGGVTIDGFGNLIRLKYDTSNFGIPLPIDLNVGDTIRISGIAYISSLIILDPQPVNPTFYITVSRFNCSEVNNETGTASLYTVIPVASYPISLSVGKVCFSELINLGGVLASNETFFVVGLGVGNDNEPPIEIDVKFSYTLDVSQACIGTGQNLLIRNCCDPAYTNVIIDNLVPVGESFVDDEGNCWTVEAKTLSAVTAVRTLSGAFETCAECIFRVPCPENFAIRSCCGGEGEIFSAALIGVNVGDTFVDTNGFCWEAFDTTPLPITNVVEVGTVYPITDCTSEVCTNLNACPTPVRLTSCCRKLNGYSTLELLQAAVPTLQIGDSFVDTFGFCWVIQDSAYAFPNLSFIVPVTRYVIPPESDVCKPCTDANPCPTQLYYTIQNCCTEEIEVVLLPASYGVGDSLLIELNVGFGCYKVLSWSNTGATTATVVDIVATTENCEQCLELMTARFDQKYCQGITQCCITYTNISPESSTITGYTCSGGWVKDFVLNLGESICMAFVLRAGVGIMKVGCCGFDISNPSGTSNLVINSYSVCGVEPPLLPVPIVIPPLGQFSSVLFGETGIQACLSCIDEVSSPYQWQSCPF